MKISGKRNDQVFQLSLTEIALILIFLLMLLLGWLTMTAQRSAREANQALEAGPDIDMLTAELERTREALRKALARAEAADPNNLFLGLVRDDKKLERDLKVEREKSAALNGFIASMGGRSNVKSAYDFWRARGANSDTEDPDTSGKELAKAEEKIADLTNQNEYLRSQVGKGFGAQPCWVENGRTQNLLDVTLELDGLTVKVPMSLPAQRLRQLRELPAIELATREFIPYSELEKSFGPILAWTKKQEPECRHYVSIQSNIKQTKLSTPKRLAVTGYFYPNEYKLSPPRN